MVEKVTVAVLLARGALTVDERLTLTHEGLTHHATVLEDGRVELQDGTIFPALSPAARAITGRTTNGWSAWRVVRLGESMRQVRARFRWG